MEWKTWDAIDPITIKKTQKCGISNSLDGMEDDWVWKDVEITDLADDEWDPYTDTLIDADILELFNSDDKVEEFDGFCE